MPICRQLVTEYYCYLQYINASAKLAFLYINNLRKVTDLNKTILQYEDIAPIKIGTSKEELVDVRTGDPGIMAGYEKFDMIPVTGTNILVRRTLANKLAKVNKRIKEEYNYTLKIVYGYRSPEVQADYFNKQRAVLADANRNMSDVALDRLTHNFVAMPEIAGHPVGGAVDLTMVDDDGVDCDMGTGIADYSDTERIQTFSNKVTPAQKRDRMILLEAMTSEGFAPFFGEWWHISYGDREWAAFYDKKSALYGPVDQSDRVSLFTSAGGNGTVVQVNDRQFSRADRQSSGNGLLSRYEKYGAEQVGFLFPAESRFEMAGGEFCGNATCVAAVTLSEITRQSTVVFSVSGLANEVNADVKLMSTGSYDVTVRLRDFSYTTLQGLFKDCRVDVVDFGGIVHILIEGRIPDAEAGYDEVLRALAKQFCLDERDAVGVIWYQRVNDVIRIDPVVWVRAVNTCFYESSCGSGSMAAALITGFECIEQPSGGVISVQYSDDSVSINTTIDKVLH